MALVTSFTLAGYHTQSHSMLRSNINIVIPTDLSIGMKDANGNSDR